MGQVDGSFIRSLHAAAVLMTRTRNSECVVDVIRLPEDCFETSSSIWSSGCREIDMNVAKC